MPNIKKHWTKKGYRQKFYQFKTYLGKRNIVCFVTKGRFFELVYPHICFLCGRKEKVITLDSISDEVFKDDNVYPVCMNCKKRRKKQEHKIPYNLRIKTKS